MTTNKKNSHFNFFNSIIIEMLENGAKKFSQHAASYYDNIGNLHFARNEYQSAIHNFSRAIEAAEKKYYLAYLHRAQAYEQQGEWENANEDFQQAINMYAPEDDEYKKIKLKLQELDKKIVEKSIYSNCFA